MIGLDLGERRFGGGLVGEVAGVGGVFGIECALVAADLDDLRTFAREAVYAGFSEAGRCAGDEYLHKALSGQVMTVAPQERPTPKTIMRIREPGLILPARKASVNTVGMVDPLVLPISER